MQKTKIKTLLVANRGEIALRIMRTAKSLGIGTIAIYAKADADAPHRHFADEAIFIGDDAEEKTYLNADKIIAVAKQAKADALHPGYGFLSENADFAEAVRANGIIFVGPPAEAIALMGNKAAAKRRMIEAGVPCVPGYEGEDQTDTGLIAQAEKIGLPLMVKAAAGGGGRGMRLVLDKNDLQDAIKTARLEAENAFGSAELILEKAISSPRHVEVQ
ncbi:MAG: ATP-grasp domain-containing protein, partial [Alphaproteobacteria bacterium]|nr:ATP-grasp domain-containing protein [Alphaproteobacteria bacterium]